MAEKLSLTKEKFTRDYAAAHEVTLKAAGELYDRVFGTIKETIDAEGKVPIPGVGVLFVGEVGAKEYPVPGTDKKVQKPTRKRVKINATPFEA